MELQEFLKHFQPTAESLERIRLGKGIVGKTSYVAITALIVLGVAVTRISTDWMRLAVGLIAVALFLFYFISTQRFADKNPGVALLEGAELIRWKQVELAAKNLPSPPATPAVVDPTKPLPSILPGKEESDR